MSDFVEKYINPFTDYGFKRLFGEEPNKDLLLDFLNVLLKEEEGEIKDLTYLKGEKLGTSEVDRIARFTPDQVRSYEDSLKYYRDMKNSLDTAKDEKATEIARRAIIKGYSIDEIVDLTGLTKEQIHRINKDKG